MMTSFDFAVLLILITGAIIAIGGLWLIRTGAVKLVDDKAGHSTIKFGEFLSIGTTVPGLGIFIVGLCFDYMGLYYENAHQERREAIEAEIASRLQQEVRSHEVHLSGTIKMADDQQIRLSVCMGQEISVASNDSFSTEITPYPDYLVIKLETEGARMQRYMIAMSERAAESHPTITHMIRPQKGFADMGSIKIDQIVQMPKQVLERQAAVYAGDVPRVPAAGAYNNARVHQQ